VALALRDEGGRLLLQKRPDHKHHGGLWEFPGGKVETEESPRDALCREIGEELGIVVAPGDLEPAFLADEGSDPAIVLFLYNCGRWQGEVVALEQQDWGWFSVAEAHSLPMPPMDRDLLHRIAN